MLTSWTASPLHGDGWLKCRLQGHPPPKKVQFNQPSPSACRWLAPKQPTQPKCQALYFSPAPRLPRRRIRFRTRVSTQRLFCDHSDLKWKYSDFAPLASNQVLVSRSQTETTSPDRFYRILLQKPRSITKWLLQVVRSKEKACSPIHLSAPRTTHVKVFLGDNFILHK